jgi:hypothetical protein
MHGPEPVAGESPEIPTLVMQHIATWSYIESVRANLLIAATMEHAELLLPLLAEVTSPGAREAILRVALRQKLDKELSALIGDVWKGAIVPVGKIRDKYAHHLWAASPDIPGSLILFDPDAGALHLAESIGVAKRGGEMSDERDRATATVYSMADIDGGLRLARDAAALALSSALVVNFPSQPPAPALALLRQAREKLPKPRPPSAQTPPEPPPQSPDATPPS